MADDRNAPATKGDLEDFKIEVNTRFEAFEHRMEQFLSEMEGRIITSKSRNG
jgi:tetrahydromethanopterin S-methyltransferase subunit G